MRHTVAALVVLGAFGASTADAQTLVLCDAEWMDVERVLALITVEVDEPPRYVFRVTDCTEESATVAVSGPNGLAREREVRLASTASEARSRLVALVLVEMVRLGTRERPAEPVVPPTEPAPTEESEPEVPPVATDPPPSPADTPVPQMPWAEDPYARSDEPETVTTATADPIVPELPWAENPYQRFDGAQTAVELPEPASLELAGPDPDPCRGDGLAARLSVRGCSAAFGIGGGVARHQLGESAAGSLWPLQLRLRLRWRFLYFGARAAGRLTQTAPWSGASVNISAYTAFVGLELGSTHFGRTLFAVGLQAETGAIRYRQLGSVGGCSSTDFFSDCRDQPQVGARSTFGGHLSLRLEIPIRNGALALEVEGGWMRGVMISSFLDPVTGMGGPQLSFSMEATFGVGGAS